MRIVEDVNGALPSELVKVQDVTEEDSEKQIDLKIKALGGAGGEIKNVSYKAVNWHKCKLMNILDKAFFIAIENKYSPAISANTYDDLDDELLDSVYDYDTGSYRPVTKLEYVKSRAVKKSPINVAINGLAGFAKSAMVDLWFEHLVAPNTDGTGMKGYGLTANMCELSGAALTHDSMTPTNYANTEIVTDDDIIKFVHDAENGTTQVTGTAKLVSTTNVIEGGKKRVISHMETKDSGFWVLLLTSTNSILYIDELNRANKRVQNILFPIINEHKIPIGTDTIEVLTKKDKPGDREENLEYLREFIKNEKLMVASDMLFTIICQNTGKGFNTETNLDSAGVTRFITYTLNPEETTQSFKQYMTDKYKVELKRTEENKLSAEKRLKSGGLIDTRQWDLLSRLEQDDWMMDNMVKSGLMKENNLRSSIARRKAGLAYNANLNSKITTPEDYLRLIEKIKAKLYHIKTILNSSEFKWDDSDIVEFLNGYNKENVKLMGPVNNRSFEHLIEIYDGTWTDLLNSMTLAANDGPVGTEAVPDAEATLSGSSAYRAIEKIKKLSNTGSASVTELARNWTDEEGMQTHIIDSAPNNIWDNWLDACINSK